jgi:hypothetical protein
MNYNPKYVSKRIGNGKRGPKIKPETWISGPDPVTRDKYYAWLKHRAQAKFRKEPYELTWEDWSTLWSNDDFLNRGRQPENLCISRRDPNDPWTLDNSEIITRLDHLRREKTRNV